METVKDDLKQAIDFIKGKNDQGMFFSKYSSSFLFTTENQQAINGILKYRFKDVLTVASSGDQYLSAVYYGAGKVDLFDINRFTYYISSLKIAAIKNLSYEEFKAFFIPIHEYDRTNNNFWNTDTFLKLIPDLPEDVGYFWDNIIFLCHKYNYGKFVFPKSTENNIKSIIRGVPFYESEREYYVLQKMLREREYPRFIESDLLTIGDAVTSSYDTIYLSNIIECLVRQELDKCSGFMFSHYLEDRVEEDFILKIMKQVVQKLRENGNVLVSYRPNVNKSYCFDLLYNSDVFQVDEVESKILPSKVERDEVDTDLILSYHPQRLTEEQRCIFR